MMPKGDAGLPLCSAPGDIATLLRETAILRELDENKIFELTGCPPTCDWNEFRHSVRVEKWREKEDISLGCNSIAIFVPKSIPEPVPFTFGVLRHV